MTPVRCKFKVTEVTRTSWGPITIKMAPVYSTDPNHENKRFWDATPSGSFEVVTTRDTGLELGKEYYLDLIPAE